MTLLVLAPTGRAEDLLPSSAFLPASAARIASAPIHEDRNLRRWKISLIPFAASQGVAVASSVGMRELNPMLAGSDGRFGAQGAAIKLGATGAFVGVQYLIIRKYPRSAKFFSKINWADAAMTSSFAVHNYMIN